MEVKVVIAKTDLGLYTMDLSTQRVRTAFDDGTTLGYFALIFTLNIVLTTVTMFNIKQERWEKQLIAEEQERLDRLASRAEQLEAGGEDNNIEAGDKDETESEQEISEEESFSCVSAVAFGCCYAVRCRCLKGGSFLNIMDFIMNVASFCSIVLKLVYSSYMEIALTEAIERDDYYNFGHAAFLFDLVNNIDSYIYLLMALSFVKTLVFWLPQVFKIFTDLLGQFFNRQTFLILLVSATLVTLGNELVGATLSPFIHRMGEFEYSNIRSVHTISGGWFWQASEEYGVYEDMITLEGHNMFLLYLCLSIYVVLTGIIIGSLFISKVIDDLAKARLIGKQLSVLKMKNDMKVIDLEIKEK